MKWLWCNAHVAATIRSYYFPHLLSVHHAFIHLHAHTHVLTMHRNNKLAQFNALPFSLPITTLNLFLSLFFMYSSPVANLLRSALKWQDSKASTIQHTTGIVPLHHTTVIHTQFGIFFLHSFNCIVEHCLFLFSGIHLCGVLFCNSHKSMSERW